MDKFKRDKLTSEILYISRDEAIELCRDRFETYKAPERRLKIEKYKKLMAEGEWGLFYNPDAGMARRFTQQPFIFLKSGGLYEGKHRIIALSEQDRNITLPFLSILGFGSPSDMTSFKQWMDKEEVEFLDLATYEKNANSNMGGHWKTYSGRWHYHEAAIEVIKTLDIKSRKQVVEVGSAGANLVIGSDSLDYDSGWNMPNFTPDIVWDIREMPWPLDDKQYRLLIALRVWQHLGEQQKESFLEALRVAKYVLLVCPTEYPNGGGVSIKEIKEWCGYEPAYEKYVKKDRTVHLTLWESK